MEPERSLENISDLLRETNLNDDHVALVERKSGEIADLATEEKFKEARTLLISVDGDLQTELLIKTLSLLYEKGDLGKAITMAKHGGRIVNVYAGFQYVFEQMNAKGESNKLEVLLLQFFIVEFLNQSSFEDLPEFFKKAVRNLRAEVDVPVENVIVSLAEDVGKRSYERSRDVAKLIRGHVLDMFIPRIIREFYSPGTLSQAAELVQYVEELTYMENKCIAEVEIYEQMKRRNQLESFEAFVHWIVMRKAISTSIQEEEQNKCQRVYDEQKANADKHIDRFLQLYDSGSYETSVTSRHK
jgi:hypothetical protein